MALPAGVDEAGGAVHHQTDAPQTAFALQTGGDVVGQPDVLDGGCQGEFAGLQYVGAVRTDIRMSEQVGVGVQRVDANQAGGVELDKPAVQRDVQAGRLEVFRPVGGDPNVAVPDPGGDVGVAEQHGFRFRAWLCWRVIRFRRQLVVDVEGLDVQDGGAVRCPAGLPDGGQVVAGS